MLLDKRDLLSGQDSLCLCMAKDMEDPLVVNDLGREGTGYKYSVITHCLNEIPDLIIVGHDIRSNGSSVDRVDPLPLRCAENTVNILERSYIADFTRYSCLSEAALKLFEFLDRCVLKKIRHYYKGILSLFIIGIIKRKKFADPGIKQFKWYELKLLLNSFVRRVIDQRFAHFQVSVHCRCSVCVDLAETEVPAALVIEKVQAGNGKVPVIRRRQKDQVLQFLRKRKQLPILRIISVLADHLIEDPDRCLRYFFELLHSLRVEDLRDLQRLFQYSIVI